MQRIILKVPKITGKLSDAIFIGNYLLKMINVLTIWVNSNALNIHIHYPYPSGKRQVTAVFAHCPHFAPCGIIGRISCVFCCRSRVCG